MVDEFADESGGDGAVEDDGVPVALAHVVAGGDGGVLGAEEFGAVGIALQVDARGEVVGDGEGEHLAGDLVNEDVGAEGGGFFRAGLGEETGDGVGEVHGGKFQV